MASRITTFLSSATKRKATSNESSPVLNGNNKIGNNDGSGSPTLSRKEPGSSALSLTTSKSGGGGLFSFVSPDKKSSRQRALSNNSGGSRPQTGNSDVGSGGSGAMLVLEGEAEYADNLALSAASSRVSRTGSNHAHDPSRAGSSLSKKSSINRRSTVSVASSPRDRMDADVASLDSRSHRSASTSARPTSITFTRHVDDGEAMLKDPALLELMTPRPGSVIHLDTPSYNPPTSPEIRLYANSMSTASTPDLPQGELRDSTSLHPSSARNYSPVFENSDAENGESSSLDLTRTTTGDSSAPSRVAQNAAEQIVKELQTSPSAYSSQAYPSPPRTAPAHITSIATATLSPETATSSEELKRLRSGSASSARSMTAPFSNIGNRKASRKSSSTAPGIAGAILLTGATLASPAPGMAHPVYATAAGIPSKKWPVGQPLSKVPSVPSSSVSRQNTIDSKTSRSGSQSIGSGEGRPSLTRTSEEASGYDSPVPMSQYTPNDSPGYEQYQNMVSIDALSDFDDLMSQIGPGYAVASPRRNADFHALFKSIPEDHWLIEDYGCALQKEILVQGRLYISEHHLCFYANIFGWVTTVVLGFEEIVAIEKRNTALVIPNAIMIATDHSRQTFTSFLSRDIAYETIISLWKYRHPQARISANAATTITDDDEEYIDDAGKKCRKRKNRFSKRSKAGSVTLPAIPDTDNDTATQSAIADGSPAVGPIKKLAHPPTSCTCASSGGHYPHVAMDAVFPGSPEKLYNLIFTSGFMREFLIGTLVTELQIGDWAPQANASNLLTRSYSYIKPLTGAVGPKTAKCMLVDENLHVDFDDFVVNLTTTRTPEVPSGGSFSVKTKTCISWSKNNSARVLVTATVEWTGRSFLRSVIDNSSMNGQKAFYVLLEAAIRKYIAQHASEFYDTVDGDGVATASIGEGADDAQGCTEGIADGAITPVPEGKVVDTALYKDRFCFVTETVPQIKPFTDFLTTIYDTLADIVGQMSPTALVCTAIILILVVSNLFTLTSMRSQSSRYVPRQRPPPEYSSQLMSSVGGAKSGEQQLDVAMAVRGVLQEYFNAQKGAASGTAGAAASTKQEIEDIRKILDEIETRVKSLKSALEDVD